MRTVVDSVFWEPDTATKDSWLEVHKLPHEAWLKEVESAQEKMKAATSQQKLASPPPVSTTILF